jgi:hypothetical protein
MTAVVAGLVINLLAAYVKAPLDTVLSRTFSWWRTRSETRKHAWETYVAQLGSNAVARQDAILTEFRATLRSIYFLLGAMFLMLFPVCMATLWQAYSGWMNTAMLAMACVAYVRSLQEFVVGTNTRMALREAHLLDKE